jgi:hypothetical protein
MFIAPVRRRERNQRLTMGAKIRDKYFVPNCWTTNYTLIWHDKGEQYKDDKNSNGNRDNGITETRRGDGDTYGQSVI